MNKEKYIKRIEENLFKEKRIKDYIDIPSQIKESNAKTKIHENFKNYDHSLEKDRTEIIREKYDYIKQEPILIDSVDKIEDNADFFDSKKDFDKDLNGLFDDLF